MNSAPSMIKMRTRRGTLWGFVLGGGALLLLVVMLGSSYVQTLEDRRSRSTLLARAAESSVTRTIEAVETALLSLGEELQAIDREQSDLTRVQRRMEQTLRFAPHIRQIALVQDNVIVLNSAGPTGGAIEWADLALDERGGQLSFGIRIGGRVPGRFLPMVGEDTTFRTTRSLVPIALYLSLPDSNAQYVVLAALNTAYLSTAFDVLGLAGDDGYALLNRHGENLLGPNGVVLDDVAEAAVQSLFATGRDEKTLERGNSLFSGAQVAFRSSAKYPLVISVSKDNGQSFIAWYDANASLIWGLTGAASFMTLAAFALMREFNRASHLQDQVRLLSAVTHQSPEAILLTNTDNLIEYVNPTFIRMFGYDMGDLAGQTPDILRSGLTRPETFAELWDTVNRGMPWHGEFVNKRKDGSFIDVESTIFPVRNSRGDVSHRIGMLSDLTAKRQAEEHIRMLSQVVEQSPVVVIITDTEGNIEYVNPQFERVSGYKPEEVIGKNPRILKSGQTSDQSYAQLWITISEGKTWVGEFHNRRKDGTFYWERAQISPLINGQKEITNYIALKEDITTLRETERQVRRAAAVFDTASEAIMITDGQNRIQMTNSAFSAITGYSQEEAQGQSPSILKSGRHDDAFYMAMHDTLKLHGTWEGEIWNRRKSGEIYPEWLTISIMRDASGLPDGYVAMFSDISRRKQDEEHIRHQANFDALTELPNRHLFKDRLMQSLNRAERNDLKVALFFIDLDHFKAVNDTLGHAVGDKLLQEAAQRLMHCVRKTDTVARLGGDEFAAVLSNLSSASQAQDIANAILEAIASPFVIEGHNAFVSASIGITMFPDDGRDVDTLIRNADSAMYRAKERGRNDAQFFTLEMSEQAARRRVLEVALHRAVANDEFKLVYQPVMDVQKGRVSYFEALIRWSGPGGLAVSPMEFIPLVEENGLILPIGAWVMREACRAVMAWNKQSGHSADEAPGVSVNVSSRQFQRQDVYALVREALADSGMPPQKLVIEITESLLLSKESNIADQLDAISNLGVRIAIDDFGTGYSSISYLKQFPISILKIDQSFVAGLPHDNEDRSLVEGILKLAEGMKLTVVAEGVEGVPQLEYLTRRGCLFFQGYYFSRPRDLETAFLYDADRLVEIA